MFINRFADLSVAYTSQYDGSLIALAAITGTLAAWIALGVSDKLSHRDIGKRWLWHTWWLSGSVILGLAVWSMHFIAMLAMQLPVPFSFSPEWTLASVIPATVACALVLYLEDGNNSRPLAQLLPACMLGAGIALMHYMGMAAMEMKATILYDPAWFGLSLCVSIALSWLALRIKRLAESRGRVSSLLALGPSVAMGLSLLGIHFTAMLGTYFFPDSLAHPARFQNIMAPETLAWSTAAGVMLVALVIAITVHLSYRLELARLFEKSADYSRNLLDTANEGIVTTDRRGIILSFNAAAEKMFGYRAAAVIGQSVMFLLPESARQSRDRFMDGELINIPRIINRPMEMEAVRANGSRFPAELNISPIHRSGHLELVGVVRDISKRKDAEKRLRDQKEHMEFLLATSPIVIYARQAVGTMPFTFVSPNVQELFGYLAEDLLTASRFWTERIHPQDLDRVLESRSQLREQGNHDIEYRLRYPNGTYRWISDRRVMTRDGHGRPSLIIGNWADIDQRKKAELQLRTNEERLRISIEHARMATWDWMIESSSVVWSDNIREKLGLGEDAPAHFDSFMDCVHPEDRQRVRAAFRRSLVLGVNFDEEYRVVWPDKSVHWLHSIGGLVNDSEGNPVQMVGVLFDITKEKSLRVAPKSSRESA